MAVADRHGLPVAVSVESATPHEVKLAESTLVQMVIPEAPQNLIGDNAYDSDKLDARLRRYGIELISPHRSNRKNRTQDLTCVWQAAHAGISGAGRTTRDSPHNRVLREKVNAGARLLLLTVWCLDVLVYLADEWKQALSLLRREVQKS